jgi:phosphotransferase system IIA component
VPARPAVIRAPLEGVIDTFHVQPNQAVKKDQPLFGFDEALIQSRLEVSRQAQATAEAEYRQAAQQALTDARSKAQLALLTGKIEEKKAEAAFLADQLQRARVLAPQDGIALFDDPAEWIGKPVAVGERIMRIASPGDVEVEAWVPLADAIPLAEQAGVSLYLNASPLSPVEASLRYLAHDAVERPDGNYAYRLRATLTEPTGHRVGLKGTARLQGRWCRSPTGCCAGPWPACARRRGLVSRAAAAPARGARPAARPDAGRRAAQLDAARSLAQPLLQPRLADAGDIAALAAGRRGRHRR